MYLCCCWEGQKALVDLAEDEGEGLLVELGVLAKLADRSGIAHSAGLLPDQRAHHVVPPSQAPVLPADGAMVLTITHALTHAQGAALEAWSIHTLLYKGYHHQPQHAR